MKRFLTIAGTRYLLAYLLTFALLQGFTAYGQAADPVAENMLAYQRSYGGWPKAVDGKKVDYTKTLSDAQRIAIKADSLHEDATIDNKATSREIVYLVKAYESSKDKRFLDAVKKGVDYLFKAQYANGGWPQYYPEHNLYRGEITYNDDAMINVLNILQDIVEGANGFDVLGDTYKSKAAESVSRGVGCILKTQVIVNGKLTVWCAQYNEKTLKPAKARAFELISLSGSESVGITEFLMRLKNPSPEVVKAVKAAVVWFEKSKITGYNFVFVDDPKQPEGKDRVFIKDPASTIWARFYDIDTNEPFFTGRDSKPKKTIAEVEVERRVGYAWYGTWPAKILDKKYPKWLKLNNLLPD
ncbi:pectate lyase [Pedobacter sp. MC2016-14]|uniref:pectate lyase n=1 Tax=Pedobacter sp. MC2016-14 TaxID=2897327 RepID=UPI001E28D395|nr:pectate lyase [Pedobacter sp. MC2016-14]MCD0488728.1 pectate lyase [Pedobacter sp. MC2016-14]